jgi:hypothetical protein
LNAAKICLAGDNVYALDAHKSRDFHGGLVRVPLSAGGHLSGSPAWKVHGPRGGANDAMIVAGDRIYISHFRPDYEPESTLQVFSTKDGSLAGEIPLAARVVKDGLAAAYGCIFASHVDGSVSCLGR